MLLKSRTLFVMTEESDIVLAMLGARFRWK